MRSFLIVCLLTIACGEPALGQGRRQRGPGGIRPSIQIQRDDSSSSNRRSDVEGSIWEFKVIDDDKTLMSGRMRIKQSSVYSVGTVEGATTSPQKAQNAAQLMKTYDKDGDDKLNVSELEKLLASNSASSPGARAATSNNGVSGQLEGLVGGRLRKVQEQDSGGDRIGDLTKNLSNEKTFRFDEDDDHALSGMAVVQPDTKRKNGVWYGRYDEFEDGRKKKRWQFEIRKIEE